MTFCDIHAPPTCMVLSQFHALMRFKDHTRITLKIFFLFSFFLSFVSTLYILSIFHKFPCIFSLILYFLLSTFMLSFLSQVYCSFRQKETNSGFIFQTCPFSLMWETNQPFSSCLKRSGSS